MGCVEKVIVSTANCMSPVVVRGSETDIWTYELCYSELVKKFRGLPAQPDFKEVWPPHDVWRGLLDRLYSVAFVHSELTRVVVEESHLWENLLQSGLNC